MKVEKRHRYVSESGPHTPRHDDDTHTALSSAENEGWPTCATSRQSEAAVAQDTMPRERIPPGARE